MTLHISCEQARRFLAAYHFTLTDLPGVFERLGTVQYDPLNPVGRNADLVFQARIPGYCVDDWQRAAYTQRHIYDAWDKQASPCKSR
ncbi:MAG TPA: crosslink repair DNA glycosylase YcaQ family protein [Ktedonobacteraceae bacterium]|nr:crosslink repair DNA glycosylase YcaQ family protein [Ktedonobacteraceae bacterium]